MNKQPQHNHESPIRLTGICKRCRADESATPKQQETVEGETYCNDIKAKLRNFLEAIEDGADWMAYASTSREIEAMLAQARLQGAAAQRERDDEAFEKAIGEDEKKISVVVPDKSRPKLLGGYMVRSVKKWADGGKERNGLRKQARAAWANYRKGAK